MRRALVLGDETALHPFRQSLPAHCRVSTAKPSRGRWLRRGGSARGRRLFAPLLSGQVDAIVGRFAGARGLLAVYCASFLAASLFLA
jgi:hypothetical protein